MPLAFDRVYSHHFERVMHSGAKQILQSSVDRYVAAIGGAYDRGRRPHVTQNGHAETVNRV
jgi:hypothetical protein